MLYFFLLWSKYQGLINIMIMIRTADTKTQKIPRSSVYQSCPVIESCGAGGSLNNWTSPEPNVFYFDLTNEF